MIKERDAIDEDESQEPAVSAMASQESMPVQSEGPVETQTSEQSHAGETDTNNATTQSNTPKRPASHNRRLPLARVKKIAKMDEDVGNLSNAAAMIIASATERFAAYFAEQAFFYTLAERKKGLNYSHCASAVARLPQLDFLSDVVPQRVQFRDTAAGKLVTPSRQEAEAAAIAAAAAARAATTEGGTSIATNGNTVQAGRKMVGVVPSWAQAKAVTGSDAANKGVTLSSVLEPPNIHASAYDNDDDGDVEMQDD